MSSVTDNRELTLRFVARYREEAPRLEKHSPAAIQGLREKAIRDFMLRGIPGRKSEEYKYTPLEPLLSPDFAFEFTRNHQDFQLKEVFKCDIPRLDTILLLTVNGWFHSVTLQGNKLPEGVLVGGLEEMASKHPELFNARYGQLADTGEDPMVPSILPLQGMGSSSMSRGA